MSRYDVNDDVKLNTKGAVERPVSRLLTLNLCGYILSSIVCLHSHSVYQKLSQEEYARKFLKIKLNLLP